MQHLHCFIIYYNVRKHTSWNVCLTKIKSACASVQSDRTWRPLRKPLTLSAPNVRRHLSSVFCYFNKLSFGKTCICKVERLNVKQRRSRWDGSSWPMLYAKAYYYRLWQRKSGLWIGAWRYVIGLVRRGSTISFHLLWHTVELSTRLCLS